MLFSCDWLADYVELPELDELSERLTFGGLNVEHVTPVHDDVVLDLEVTPNRPDAMNHLGVAREISVLCDAPLSPPRPELEEGERVAAELAAVEVEDLAGCPRYAARIVEGIQVGPSPEWIQRRLEAVGVRPISNVVDVTNYVLWEMGQPMHAFDLDRLAQSTIVVRRAAEGETLITLDGETRKLVAEDLVIADRERGVAIAGVMGGQDTEVGDSTTRVLLESAHFDPVSVRKTSKRLGVHTDASHRFERGTDPDACVRALDRAATLLAEIAGGAIAAGAIDVVDPACLERATVEFEPGRLDAFAGVDFERESLRRWLDGLGFELQSSDGELWRVLVPTWRRFDVERAQDVYEEAIRVLGFDKIPAALPVTTGADGPETSEQRRRRQLRAHLAGQGFAEAIHYSFISEDDDRAFPVLTEGGAPIELLNPLSELYTVMRRSMVAGLAHCAELNQRRGAESVRFFELGNIFLDREIESLGLVMGGVAGSPWDGARQVDLFDLKGVVDSILDFFDLEIELRPAELAGILTGTGAELRASGTERVGYFGKIDSEGSFPVFVAEILCSALGTSAEVSSVDIPSRFPGIGADLTLTHSTDVSWGLVAAAIRDQAPEDLVDFSLRDRYLGEGVPDGAVNTTIGFHYNARDRSLTQDEINDRQTAIARALEASFGWREGGAPEGRDG
ncbi:MAG: phenylalanine--tRNA ligase subunit beta [Acidobacteriota bacterium]|nr:phenylalanine--tRNA ligase subunit beta [Acidobacteriota bacterium]